jgi:hypothetical protein
MQLFELLFTAENSVILWWFVSPLLLRIRFLIFLVDDPDWSLPDLPDIRVVIDFKCEAYQKKVESDIFQMILCQNIYLKCFRIQNLEINYEFKYERKSRIKN